MNEKRVEKSELPATMQVDEHWLKNGRNAPVPAKLVRKCLQEWARDNQAHDRLSRALERALENYGS